MILLVLLLLLFSSLWVGHGSYPEIWKLESTIERQKWKNVKQEKENRRIQSELDDAKTGDDAVEERARSELGMIKKGEVFYEVILKPSLKKDKALPLYEDLSIQNKK